jgi:hypothetical protein
MRVLFAIIILCCNPFIILGQKKDTLKINHFPKHFISVNPLNILFFQQVGITYEFKPGVMSFGVTGGYIYPNHKAYSNYFIAGPTNDGSLGDYSGFFLVPQVNVFLIKPKHEKHTNLIYISLKAVYKNMHIDSLSPTAWENYGDGYYLYRKMDDRVNVYGGFIGFGFRHVFSKFFIDLNLGIGALAVDHKMIISGECASMVPTHMHYYNPPLIKEIHDVNKTINFTINFGVAL